MAKWIRKLDQNISAFRVSIPKGVIEAKGWLLEKYLVIDDSYGEFILIGRLPGDDKKHSDGKESSD